MRSLKLEAKDLAEDMDEWLGSSRFRSRTRAKTNHVTATTNRKRRRKRIIVKETTIDDDRHKKRRLFEDEDEEEKDLERGNSERVKTDDSDVEIISSTSEKTESTNQGLDDYANEINCVCPTGSTKSVLMEDKDYIAYLNYITETWKGDFDAMLNEGNVDCEGERVSTEQVGIIGGSNEEALNGAMNGIIVLKTTDDGNVDCERVSTETIDIMKTKGSEDVLCVGMNGIVYEKINDDDNVGCENFDHTLCVYEGVSPEQVYLEDKCDTEYLEHGNTNADSDPKLREGNSDSPLEMLADNVGCRSQSSEEGDVDPDYKIFLDNVREDEYSYIFERKKEDETTVFVRYEEDNEKLIEDSMKDERVHLNYCSSPERVKDLTDKVKSKTKVLENDFGKTNGSPSEQPRRMAPHWLLSGCKPGTIFRADESYLKFLDHVWVEGDVLTFKYEGVIVKYGDDSRVVADPSGLQQKDMSEDDSDSVQILDSGIGKGDHKKEFNKLLRKEISKPYDKYELKVSLKNARVRKYKELDKETRGTWFSIPTKRKRKSYLGHYPDLERLLNGALEEPVPRERALALLRCLFFHVKHQPHPGYYAPWRCPPTWLHDRICCCQGILRNCPIKKRSRSKNRVVNQD